MDLKSIAKRLSFDHTSIDRTDGSTDNHNLMKDWVDTKSGKNVETVRIDEYSILKSVGSTGSRDTYFLCSGSDGSYTLLGFMTLGRKRDGNQVWNVKAFSGGSIKLIRTLYDFALTLGPVYSSRAQSPEDREAWYEMLKDGYKIELLDSYRYRPMDVALFPDSSRREISTGPGEIPLYDDDGISILKCSR